MATPLCERLHPRRPSFSSECEVARPENHISNESRPMQMAKATAQRVANLVQAIKANLPSFPDYESLYKDLHVNAELSRQESRTAIKIAARLKSHRVYHVVEHVGGHGVVGTFQNGHGPKVMLRADMDALPIKEDTNLPYASTQIGTDAEGNSVLVAHACKSQWSMYEPETPLMVSASRRPRYAHRHPACCSGNPSESRNPLAWHTHSGFPT